MKKYLPAFVTCLLLIAFTLVGFSTSLNSYTTNNNIQFEQLAEARVDAIQRSLADKLLILESMRSMYDVYGGRPQPEFGSFVQPFEDGIPGVQALQWVVPVNQDERESFELDRQREGFTGFRITELHGGDMVRAGPRDIYYPVYPVLPFDEGEESIGFDLGSDPVRRHTLETAISTGRFTASAWVRLLQAQDSSESGFLIMAPLYSGGTTVPRILPRQVLLGLVIGVFRVSDIVEAAITPLDFEAINLLVEDTSDATSDTLVYHYRPSGTGDSGAFSPDPINMAFDFADRTWAITASPAEGYMATRQPTTPFVILALGLILSLILTLYLVMIMRQNARLRESEMQRQQMETLLLQSQKMEAVGQLVGGIAHDFNNMLTTMLGYTELALDNSRDKQDKQQETYLKQVFNGAMRGRDLIQKLLTFSRKAPGKSGPLDIAPLVENTLGLIQPLITSSIVVRLDKTDANLLPQIKIDPTSLDQLIINLCINARDAIDGQGEIRITLGTATHYENHACQACGERVRGNFVTIAVTDNGTGISPEEMNIIFQPFYTTKAPGKGTGMGLSIINTIVHNSEGHILVRSTPGTGTTFELLMPAISA